MKNKNKKRRFFRIFLALLFCLQSILITNSPCAEEGDVQYYFEKELDFTNSLIFIIRPEKAYAANPLVKKQKEELEEKIGVIRDTKKEIKNLEKDKKGIKDEIKRISKKIINAKKDKKTVEEGEKKRCKSEKNPKKCVEDSTAIKDVQKSIDDLESEKEKEEEKLKKKNVELAKKRKKVKDATNANTACGFWYQMEGEKNKQGICVKLLAPFEDKSQCGEKAEECRDKCSKLSTEKTHIVVETDADGNKEDVKKSDQELCLKECNETEISCMLGIVTGRTSDEFIHGYIGKVYKFAAYLIGGISVMMMIIGGVQIALGGAQSDMQTKGKDRITAALTGLILFFVAGLILYTINPNFFKM